LKGTLTTLLRTIACAAGLLALLAAPAAAADWDVFDVGASASHLNSVSCPALELCVAVGTNSTFAVSSRPAGGAAAWRTSDRPQSGRADGYLRGVDCPSRSLCVAVESTGAILTTTEPMAGIGAWTTTRIPGVEGLNDVACTRASRCVAVGDGGLVVTSADPAAGAGAWSAGLMAPPLPLHQVACPPVGVSCVAIAGSSIAGTTDLMAGAAGWELKGGSPRGEALGSVDCPSEAFCAIGVAGGVLTTAAPTGLSSGWARSPISSGFQVLGIDCAAAGLCAAGTDNGEAFASSGPGGSWIEGRLSGARPGGFYDVSCPSLELCVAVGEAGQVASSTNPFAVPAQPAVEAPRPKRPRTVVFGKHFRRLRLRGGKKRAGIRFHFTANGQFTGFRCKLDRRPYRRCRDPKSYALGLGSHVFRVRAFGPGGADRTPEVVRVKVIAAHTD
jgi:hypothetical protein